MSHTVSPSSSIDSCTKLPPVSAEASVIRVFSTPSANLNVTAPSSYSMNTLSPPPDEELLELELEELELDELLELELEELLELELDELEELLVLSPLAEPPPQPTSTKLWAI